MKSKTLLIFIIVVVVVIIVFVIKNKSQVFPPVQENNSTGTSTTTQQVKWISFINDRFKYAFEYPDFVSRDITPGRGADFSSDIDSIVTLSQGSVGIFNVTRLYLDEKTITGGINLNIALMRKEGASEKDIQDYSQRMKEEFTNTRKYRDIPLKDFALLVQKATGSTTEPLIKTTLGDISAYRFTWKENNSTSELAVSLRLGYGFLSKFGTHTFILFESPIGEKYYIHYLSGNETSLKILQSFHFLY